MTPIPYQPEAHGFTGFIAGQAHWVLDPQELLNRANQRWPHLLFVLVKQV